MALTSTAGGQIIEDTFIGEQVLESPSSLRFWMKTNGPWFDRTHGPGQVDMHGRVPAA